MTYEVQTSASGKEKKLYYHIDCYEKHLAHELYLDENKIGRIVICQTCKETELYKYREKYMVLVERETSGGAVKKAYYHIGDCYDKGLKKEAFLDEEKSKQDELDAVVKELHGLKLPLPSRYWETVQDMRNGTARYTRNFKKHYKEGVPYDVLKEAYIMSRHDIEWAKLNRRFKTIDIELFYCLKIAHSKVNDASRKILRTKQSLKMANAKESGFIEDMLDNREVTFVKKKSEFDFSHILGDD